MDLGDRFFVGIAVFNLGERKGFNERGLPAVTGTLFIAALATVCLILGNLLSSDSEVHF